MTTSHRPDPPEVAEPGPAGQYQAGPGSVALLVPEQRGMRTMADYSTVTMQRRCVECGVPRPQLQARGLGPCCYNRVRRRGELLDYPRVTWSRDEVLTEWVQALRPAGLDYQQAAKRLGMTYAAFEQQLVRARRAGDPRAMSPVPYLPRRGTLQGSTRGTSRGTLAV